MIQITIHTKTSKISGEFLDPHEAKIFIDKVAIKKTNQMNDLEKALEEIKSFKKSDAISHKELQALIHG
jgi:hypothetical protein